jgi:hypothetical protein
MLDIIGKGERTDATSGSSGSGSEDYASRSRRRRGRRRMLVESRGAGAKVSGRLAMYRLYPGSQLVPAGRAGPARAGTAEAAAAPGRQPAYQGIEPGRVHGADVIEGDRVLDGMHQQSRASRRRRRRATGRGGKLYAPTTHLSQRCPGKGMGNHMFVRARKR